MPTVVNTGRSVTSARYATDDDGLLPPCGAPGVRRIEAEP